MENVASIFSSLATLTDCPMCGCFTALYAYWMFEGMLRPIAENTFAESQFEECQSAEIFICRNIYLPKYLFAEIFICQNIIAE
jgi:hypothetical protein